jgi:hypothetical protein
MRERYHSHEILDRETGRLACTFIRTEVTIMAMETPILASRIVRITPGRSGSLSSASAVGATAAAAAGGGTEEMTPLEFGTGADGAEEASTVLSRSHAGVLASILSGT